MEQRTCPHCGTANAPNASTCSWCGRSLVQDADATQPLGRPMSAPPGDGPSWTPSEPQQPSGGSWEPPTQPQEPSGGSWQPPTQPQEPSGGSWQPPTQQGPGGGWGQPSAPQQPAADWGQPQQQSWGQAHPAPGGYQQDAPAGGQQGWGAQGEVGQPQWGSGAPPEPPRKRNPLLLVGLAGVLVIVLAVVAIRVIGIGRSSSDDPLQAPANVGGFNRIDRGTIRSQLDVQSNQLRQRGARNFVVAAYGTELQPQFILVAVREASDRARQDVIKGFDQALVQQSAPGGSQDQTFEQNGVDYRCSSSQIGTVVAICRFDDGDVVGFGFSPGVTPQRVSQLTADARNQMTD